MIAFVLALLLIWIVIALIGVIVKGLIWLTIIAGVLFLATIFFGGSRAGRRGITR